MPQGNELNHILDGVTVNGGVAIRSSPSATPGYLSAASDGSLSINNVPVGSASNGLPGRLAGPVAVGNVVSSAPTAQRQYILRVYAERPMTITKVGFIVETLDATDDPVHAGGYTVSGTTLTLVGGGSGAVSGKLNSTGIKTVTIPTLTLAQGQTGYISLLVPTVTGTPQLLASNGTDGLRCWVFGTTAPNGEAGIIDTRTTLIASADTTSAWAQPVAALPILWAMELQTLDLSHEDTMADADQSVQWGLLQAVSADRVALNVVGDGDARPKGDGTPQTTRRYRRLTLKDGDDFSGERVELGANERRNGTSGGAGTFMLYPEGTHYETWFSLRLPSSFPINTPDWCVVMQMKQTQPYTTDNGGAGPIIEMDVRSGNWMVITNGTTTLFTAPAKLNVWTRFRIDARYFADPTKGRIRIQIDDRANATTWVPQYDSGVLTTAMLTTAVGAQSGPGWSLNNGDSIPAHLRLGIYRNPIITGDTSIDVGNVQVYDATRSN